MKQRIRFGVIFLLLVACKGEKPPFSPSTPSPASFETISITDEELLELVYSTYKHPEDFYHEELDGASIYYENSLSILPLHQRTDHCVELSTNDHDQALAWSESTAVHSAYYRYVESEQDDEKYFQFRRVRQMNPQDVVLSRVHKLSYLDRSMYDSFYPTRLIGKFNQRPISAERVQTLVQYFWWISSYQLHGAKALATVTAETADSVKCALYDTQVTYGDWGLSDQIALNRRVYAVSKETGEIRRRSFVIRTLQGKAN